MRGAELTDGALALFDRANLPSPGRCVVALHDGEVTPGGNEASPSIRKQRVLVNSLSHGLECCSHIFTKMFATIRQYDTNIDQTAELNRIVQEEFVPLLQSLPGFISYQWIDVGNVGGRMVSVSVFDTAEHAEGSNKAAAIWVKSRPDFGAISCFVEAGPVVAHG